MKWKTQYATGIHNIDQQHREIVDLITQFENLPEGKAVSHEAHPLILRTKVFMQFHFAVEESLMRLLPYPDRDAHRAEHQRELEHIADIERRMLRGDKDQRLAQSMRNCLFGHIVTGDKQLAQYALGLFGPHSTGKGRGGATRASVRFD